MDDWQARRPWGMRRALRRHAGQSGLVVYGWFSRWRLNPFARWLAVGIWIDGEPHSAVDVNSRLAWVPLASGHHVVKLAAGFFLHHSYEVTVAHGEAYLIAFRPPRGFAVADASNWGPLRQVR